jgi:peptide/nickel transport system substrate-binding protein
VSPARGAALALAAALFAGCAAPESDGPRLNAVRLVMSNDPTSLSLVGNTDRTSNEIAALVSEGLVDFDAASRIVPRVAESWTIARDGTEIAFRLRAGVRWHDGRPVTARDVAFTVGKIRDPRTQSRAWGAMFADVVSVESPDDRTVVIRYARPYADMLEAWRAPLLPEHLAGREPDLLTSAFAQAPVGCGAFRFVRWTRRQEIVLEANPDYWDGRPDIERLSFLVKGDDRSIYEALLKGEVDVWVATPEMWRESLTSARAARLDRFVNWRLAVWVIGWNQDGSNPFFADARVRRAMVLALDRERFAATAARGLARPVAGTILAESGWQNASVRPWPFDPIEAGRLLDEAGWRDADGNGVLERDGVPFEFELVFPAGPQEIADRMAAWVRASLADVGVRAEVVKLEWQTFQQRRREHRFQAAMASLSFSPSPDRIELYHSNARLGGYNYVGFSDAEVDRLLERGRVELDRAKRQAIYDVLQARLHELEPITPVFQFAQPVLFDARLAGLRPSPSGLVDVYPGPRGWRWNAEEH